MKKLLITLLLGATATLVNAKDYNLNVECVPFRVIDDVTAEYNELPFIRGASIRGGERESRAIPFVFFLNARTGTWTFTERISETEFCILASGDKFEPVPADVIDRTIERRKGS
jgi:hypothetical protein